MNNIKFRVFAPNSNKFIYFTLDDLIDGGFNPRDSAEYGYLSEYQQSTGLKDKNGHEIYEGDIVKMHVDTNFVHVMLGYSQPELVFRNYLVVRVPAENNQPERLELKSLEPEPTYVETGSKQMKIIGNIHQNPELIKEFNK